MVLIHQGGQQEPDAGPNGCAGFAGEIRPIWSVEENGPAIHDEGRERCAKTNDGFGIAAGSVNIENAAVHNDVAGLGAALDISQRDSPKIARPCVRRNGRGTPVVYGGDVRRTRNYPAPVIRIIKVTVATGPSEQYQLG